MHTELNLILDPTYDPEENGVSEEVLTIVNYPTELENGAEDYGVTVCLAEYERIVKHLNVNY